MLRLIQNLFGTESKKAKRKSRPSKHGQRRVLGMEGLESRDLMAVVVIAANQPVAPAAVTVSIENHDLVIRGTNNADNVTVTSLDSYDSGKYEVKVIKGNVTTKSIHRITGGDIFFHGNNGDDKFSVINTFDRVTAFGGEGNDQLNGSWGNDHLNGDNGGDTLRGSSGNDTLKGGAHDDEIFGGNHNDFIDGGTGADHIFGENNNDTILAGFDFAPNVVDGGGGNDTITGGYGQDELNGGDGNDTIDGNLGRDEIFGGAGNDTLYAGNDFESNHLRGGLGDDTLHGSSGDDLLEGNDGHDILFGYAGNDTLRGSTGFDQLFGGDGNDKLDGGGNDNRADYVMGQAGIDEFWIESDTGWGYDPDEDHDAQPGEIVHWVGG